MNAAVEFHDTAVRAVSQSGEPLVIHLDPAYVHRSTGRPGIDSGSCWCQAVDLVFAAAVLESAPLDFPCILDDGTLSAGALFINRVPIPFAACVPARFEARGLYGEMLTIRAAGVNVVPVGKPVYVEEFSGTS